MVDYNQNMNDSDQSRNKPGQDINKNKDQNKQNDRNQQQKFEGGGCS